MKWADPFPLVLAKIDQVLKLPDITEAECRLGIYSEAHKKSIPWRT
jgi:hypothetical protein